MEIYVQKNGQQLGPFPEPKIREGIDAGEFAPEDLGWREGLGGWLPISQILQPNHPISISSVHTTWMNRLAIMSVLFGVVGLFVIFGHHAVLWFICAVLAIFVGHYVCWRTRASSEERSTRKWAQVGLLTGYASFPIIMLFTMFSSASENADTTPTANSTPAVAQVRVEEIIGRQLQGELDANKQKIFDHIHPVGTAKSVTLHDVTVTAWKHGRDTNRFEDVQEFTFRYTLYWSGPVTTDGYTKITQTYDNESRRYTEGKVLATNGITNGDAQSALGTLLGTALQYQAQKAGAEQATREYYNNNQ